MNEVTVRTEEQTKTGWRFVVDVSDPDGETHHTVELDRDYWDLLTGGSVHPERLATESLKFLLDHEPKESILETFNIRVIQDYFPEYEDNIRERIK